MIRKERKIGRRDWLKAAGFSVLAVGTSQVLGRDWRALAKEMEKTLAGDTAFPHVSGLTPEVTPNDQFYTVSIGFFGSPKIDQKRWRLEVKGLVERPYTLTYEELLALPAVEEYATLKCIGDSVDGHSIGNALWKGVRLRDLIARGGGAKQEAIELILRAEDEYSDSFPLSKAMEDGTILAYGMNGEILPGGHGFPARVLVPGIYGMKNVKWLTGLEVADYDYQGYWMQSGWDDVATYRTISRIDLPEDTLTAGKPAFIAGVAFSGERGIQRVEISLDDGITWHDARVKQALSSYTWVLWAYEWKDPTPGTYTVTARATDGTGAIQETNPESSFPKGASGLHRIEIRVKGSRSRSGSHSP
jgi:DMSO/TMAO reductase YedYZ molybdopterin-dependent catalytic subunit